MGKAKWLLIVVLFLAPACQRSADPAAAPAGNERCKASEWCRVRGLCSAKDGACIATSDADCRASKWCRDYGHCTAGTNGECIAASHEDCRASMQCRRHGRCTAGTHGKCFHAMTDADCRELSDCKRYGECTAKDNKCIVGSDADCRASERCKTGGVCTAKDNKCIIGSDADCRASEACKHAGWCTAGTIGRCIELASDADCRASLGCKSDGRCTFKDGKCIAASDADCKASTSCKQSGHCTAKDGVCFNQAANKAAGGDQEKAVDDSAERPRATHRVAGTSSDRDAPFLALRDAPRSDARLLAEMPDGTRLRLLSQRGKWLQVMVVDGAFAGQIGWANRRWLAKE